MSDIIVRRILRKRFPDSGWALELEVEGPKVTASLFWDDKIFATHQMRLSTQDLRELLGDSARETSQRP